MSSPFWESTYADLDAPDAFGPPAREIVDLSSRLAPGCSVLDLGCGEGRNALFLAARDCRVHAVDVSEAAIRKLQHRAHVLDAAVEAQLADLSTYEIQRTYDVILAHGVLHFLVPEHRDRLLRKMQQHTRPDGYNVVAAFTDLLPAPEDLAPFLLGLFSEGELVERYLGWEVLLQQSYVFEDEHPGRIRHQHPINKIIAQRPRV